MREFALTTTDNPYNPITQFDQWYVYDTTKGYNTCQYLARIAMTADGMSDNVNSEIIEQAIDEIVKENILGLVTEYKVNYVKVVA